MKPELPDRYPPSRTAEQIAMAGDSLLDVFREVDRAAHHSRISLKHNLTQSERMLEERHSEVIDAFAALPGSDLELARYTYEQLTDSDDPRDRYWAAVFLPRMLGADKALGLSMLERLIGSEETEQKVQDTAWDVLTTEVASLDLLPFSEAVAYVDLYHSQYTQRLLRRIRTARRSPTD